MSDESRIARLEKVVGLIAEATVRCNACGTVQAEELMRWLAELRATKRREEVRKELGIGLGEHSDYDMR